MRCLVRLLFVSLVLAAAPAAASECPMCKPIDDWFAQNGAACGYHGNRLPSICETDPECVEWNRACGAMREELNACIQRCMSGEQPPPPPPPQSQVPELDEFDRDVAEMERTGYVVHNNQQSPEWCRQARNRLAAVDPELFAGGLVGRISDAFGAARVNLCMGGVVNAEPGMPVRVGDCIETGPEGKVRILVNHDIDLSPDAFPFMAFRDGTVAGLPARVVRVSFTGELSFEVNVAPRHMTELWDKVMSAGASFGIEPVGSEGSHVLRVEKGFLSLGHEVDGTVDAFDLGMGWIMSKKKPDYIGKRSVEIRRAGGSVRRELVGLLPEDPNSQIPEGAPLTPDGAKQATEGLVTACVWSVVNDRWVALALLENGHSRHSETAHVRLTDRVIPVQVTNPVFHDPDGIRLRS